MTNSIQAISVLVALLLLFVPAIVLIVASIRVLGTVKDASVVFIAVGAVMLTLASLDFLYSFFVALLFGAVELATYALYSTYIFKAVNYLALLLIGFGLIRFSKIAARIVHEPQINSNAR